MKKMIIFLLLFTAIPAVAQIAAISLNPFKKVTLIMRDGSTEEGFAIQAHDPESVIYYKDIQVKPLP